MRASAERASRDLCSLPSVAVVSLRHSGARGEPVDGSISLSGQRLCARGLPCTAGSAETDIRLRLIWRAVPPRPNPSDRGVGGNGGRLSGRSRGLLEFTFKAEYAYRLRNAPVADQDRSWAFSPLRLERMFLGRHKLLHFRIWYRDSLSDYVRQMLLDPLALSRPYLERKRLEDIVQSHVTGERNYTTAIHKLLTIELIHRLFLDTPLVRFIRKSLKRGCDVRHRLSIHTFHDRNLGLFWLDRDRKVPAPRQRLWIPVVWVLDFSGPRSRLVLVGDICAWT